LAFGSFSTQVDFRQFDIGAAWAERFGTEFGTGGAFVFGTVTYPSRYAVNFDLDNGLDGHLRMFGDGFSQNASGHLTAGLIRAFAGFVSEGISTVREFYVTNLSVSAVSVHAAMRTLDAADDQLVLRDMFRGNDTITLSAFADIAYGAEGNDTVSGNGGSDRLFGQAGDDVLRGGYGNDSLFGNLGADQLIGGPGADVLQGGVGNDTLTGGTGVDRFEFKAGDGNDRVLDWTDGVDELRFYGPVSTITVALNELPGGDVRLTVLGMQIVIENAVLADFQLISGSGFISVI
jgi:Ca2+-binding RTX toxin-like protein